MMKPRDEEKETEKETLKEHTKFHYGNYEKRTNL